MKIIFAGTPEFAATALKALLAAGFDVPMVLSQPDRPAGRGMKLHMSAVKEVALAHGIAVAQPRSLRLGGKYADDAAAAQSAIAAAGADVMVVAAYGLILPQWTLDAPRLGCLNIHGSLLPRWRGAAPIQRAILAGDGETGITIMHMDEGLDTGDILLRQAIPIGADETAGQLHDRLAALGAKMIVEALTIRPAPVRQDSAGACYAAKLSKDEAMIDWHEDADTIARKVRAFNPFPGASTLLTGERIKLWRAQPAALADGAPGTVCAAPAGQLWIACGKGALSILELQRAGGKRMAVAQFLAGCPMAAGTRFGT